MIFPRIPLFMTFALLFTAHSAFAFDLSGPWAVDASSCQSVFGTTKNGALFIKSDSDSYGGGFIVQGKKIVGKIAKCSILRETQEKDVVRVVAACSTDVALANVQFAFRIHDNNKITRLYPGMEDLNVDYERCAF